MREYRRGSHMVYEVHVHVCWATKYRYEVLVGDVATRLRELVRQICEANEIRILRGHVAKDHVHVLPSMPAKLGISRMMQHLKGKTSHKMQMEFPRLRKRYWGRHLWARGYFCASTGNVTDDMIAEYIERHETRDERDGFGVEGESHG